MHRNRRWLVSPLAVAAATLLVSACAQPAAAPASAPKPVTVQKVEGSTVSRITLSEQGARLIDLQQAEIREVEDRGIQKRALPHAAVVYDKSGAAWTYTEAEPLTFVRQSVSVDSVKGDLALLKDGPAPGTRVVTTGVAELYGAEFGIGK
jgi:hypothetical protein